MQYDQALERPVSEFDQGIIAKHKLVPRYVITFQDREGFRAYLEPRQGRCTYATHEDCQSKIDAILNVNNAESLSQLFGNTQEIQVRRVYCWPGHFDPVILCEYQTDKDWQDIC